jgi:acyl-coenzyme A synthetase/AMP-(fatty) acid ligase
MKVDSVRADFYKRILCSGANLSCDFILQKYTYGDIHRLAAKIRTIKSMASGYEVICLCTQDKTLIAAAMLAALSGGPKLVLPHSFSKQVLLEAQNAIPFSAVLTDYPMDALTDLQVKAIHPKMLHAEAEAITSCCHPDDPFLTLFTGGSTGKPTLWSKTPRNIITEALYLSQTFNITDDDIILSTVPPQHIYGLLFSVMIPLVTSCKVVSQIYAFPREILNGLFKHDASILVSVPIHYRALSVDDLKELPLRMAFSSAGVLHKEDAELFCRKTGLDITDIYGSTETGGIASRGILADGQAWKSFDIVEWTINNEMLHVRSDFLSPELPRDEKRFFVTADRAEYAEGQRFTLHGRLDDIVKVGGKRVDLADVQNKLKQITGIRDAIVVALPTNSGRGSEIAALVAGKVDASHLRQRLSQLCEPYAIPRHIAIVESIPTLPTGKYDRTSIEQFLRARNLPVDL